MDELVDLRDGADLGRNAIIGGLPRAERAWIAERVDVRRLPPKARLHERGAGLDAAWFPLGAVVTMVGGPEGQGVELASVGDEGVVGLFLFLGARDSPAAVDLLIGGPIGRLPLADYIELLAASAAFRLQVHRWARAMYAQLLQNVVCARSHSVEQRTSRWLLATSDRVGDGDDLPLTQGQLAQMLGVRRATVTVAAGALQAAGCIRYRRGQVSIVDPEALHRAACGCYDVVRGEFELVRTAAPRT